MKKVLLTEEGKKVVIDTKQDARLYESPQNPPNTGTRYTRGTNLYCHETKNKNKYFYFYSWSMWQGEGGEIVLCSKKEAEDFLIEKAGNVGWDSLDDTEYEYLEKYGFNLLEENA
jgi:hypothetical protein